MQDIDFYSVLLINTVNMLGKSLKQTRKAKQLQQNSKISWFAVGNHNKNGQIKIISSMDLFW